MTPDDIHWILIKECVRVGLPTAYTRDLTVHDRNNLIVSKTQRFLYAVRSCGTHMIPLDQDEAYWGNTSAYSMTCAIHRTYDSGDDVRWYLFSHGELSPITLGRAETIAHGAL